jgi:hypothetical protein
MRIARQIGLLLVAVCALGAMATSSASAATPLFLFHGTGGRLLASAGTSQTLSAGGQQVVCKAVSVTGTAPALRFLNLLATAHYSSCTLPALGLEATVDLFQLLIDANGLVRLDSSPLILVKAIECTITLPAAKNQSLNTVKIENTAANKGVLLLVNLTKITSVGTGGCAFTEESAGTDEGTIHVTADGGLLKWDLNA